MPRTKSGQQLTALLHMPHKPTLYAAGKIAKQDWRYVLYDITAPSPGGRFCSLPYGDDNLWDPNYREDFGSFYYSGPFFVSCDHGCAHGPAQHASYGACFSGDDELAAVHRKVWATNHHRLKKADIVFVYLNETDCHGTLIEVGQAAELGKAIAVGFGSKLTDEQVAELWMATMPAQRPSYGANK